MSRRSEGGEPVEEYTPEKDKVLEKEYATLGDALLDYFDDDGLPRHKEEAKDEKEAEQKRKPVPRGKTRKKCEVCGSFFLTNELPQGSSDYEQITWREQHRMCQECAQLNNISANDRDKSWNPRDFRPGGNDNLPGDVIHI